MGQKESSTRNDSFNSEFESDLKTNSNNTIKTPREWYDVQLLKRCENVYFDVEAWYKVIQSETFYTEFIPISPSIAQAFVNFYQTRYTSTKLLNSNDIHLIASIQNQLKEQIFSSKTNNFQSNGTFIRLSSRSPKDGKPLDSRKISQFYDQKLSELQIQYPDDYKSIEGKANMQMIAYCYAQFHSLKVTDETQALNLILSSERVYYDLIEVLDCQQLKDNKVANINNIKLHDWNNNIIIREWNDLLDPSMEFRCFIYQSNLTAISQYNYYCKYYHLQNDVIVQQIKRTIIKYWQEKIQPLLDPLAEKYSNYVIDIGLIENKLTNEYDCIVIEMNPFETSTGASLFNWIIDSNQLRGGRNETEIRVQSDYYPYIKDYIEFILEINQCDGKENSSSDHHGKEPYFIFLDQMKTQLSL
ncbi:unnamed protein product [Rotaria sp. Silwood2]|nr:unnamed protein product [Rotaria sp. Silwood2]CAF3119688.1 unnamed protein product [Rotaria sp. Silwood2]CAF4102848.1 unnamed protein product [Rotaria sp. Silwood2]CAF4444967.1 unnamed protein product [Rotaria sp. Silwood2]